MLLPTKHVVTIRIEIGAALVLVALGGQALTHESGKNKTMYLWIDPGFISDDDEGATPFLLVKVRPSMMIWLEHDCAMQGRGGKGSNQRNCRVVEQTGVPGVDCQIRQ